VATYASPEVGNYGDIDPIIQAIPLGRVIKIFCFSYDKPSWNFKPHHSTFDINNKNKEKSLRSRYLTSNDSVYIRVAREKHSGNYSCKGTYINGTSFVATSPTYVARKL